MTTVHGRGIALVTGATAGLGAQFASQLAQRGHPLVLVARDRARLEASAASLQLAHGVRVEIIIADLATDEGVDRVVARLVAQPAIDVLANNAGFGTKGNLATADPAAQDAMVRLHVLAVHRLTQAALPAMVAAGRGAIITVSSVASYLTSAGNMNYCATKAYQRVSMEALANEVGEHGIYVQALCPGLTHTEFHRRAALRMTDVPASLWMEADEVVRASLQAMDRGGPTVVVPGFKNRVMLTIARLMPPRIMAIAAAVRRRRARQVSGR
ncbi:MAG: SDR family oxidoreductase [Gemmatimonadaceae bacterium]